jgi:uncharacterized membrane protein YjjB (DUF3815 family)
MVDAITQFIHQIIFGDAANFWPHIVHQAMFGGVAAAGFGILFNCPPRMISLCFGAGALTLAVRTVGQSYGMALPEASFIAALVIALVDRTWWLQAQSLRASVLAVVGCIPMVPGSMAAKGLKGIFEFMHAKPGQSIEPGMAAFEYLITVAMTLAAIGTALALPTFILRQKKHAAE